MKSNIDRDEFSVRDLGATAGTFDRIEIRLMKFGGRYKRWTMSGFGHCTRMDQCVHNENDHSNDVQANVKTRSDSTEFCSSFNGVIRTESLGLKQVESDQLLVSAGQRTNGRATKSSAAVSHDFNIDDETGHPTIETYRAVRWALVRPADDGHSSNISSGKVRSVGEINSNHHT